MVSVRSDEVELASDALWGLGVVAVEEREGADGIIELWTSLGDDAVETDLPWPWRFVEVDASVADTWRQFATPIWVEPDLVVRPAWVPFDAPPGVTVLHIEPGATFGMGDHPTTVLSLRAARRLVTPGCTVLDVGGGNGVVTRRLLQEGYQAALLEPSAAGCQNARLLRAIDLVLRSTLEEAALPDGCADAVGLFDVLEHIADDRACLTEIHRVLKPGGRLFLTVPAFPFLWSANDPAAGHYKRYTRASLARVLDGLFHIEFSSYLFACLLPPLFLLRSLPYRLRLTRRALLDESAEHGTTENTLVRLIRHLLERERHRLQQGKTLPFGTSCVVVARRV